MNEIRLNVAIVKERKRFMVEIAAHKPITLKAFCASAQISYQALHFRVRDFKIGTHYEDFTRALKAAKAGSQQHALRAAARAVQPINRLTREQENAFIAMGNAFQKLARLLGANPTTTQQELEDKENGQRDEIIHAAVHVSVLPDPAPKEHIPGSETMAQAEEAGAVEDPPAGS